MADKKITDYDAAASLALTDLIEAVVDPSGTPVSKKATLQQVATVVGTDTDIADAISKKHEKDEDTYLDKGGANEVTAAQAKAAYTHSGVTSGNPHAVSKSDVGLGNVTNEAQIAKSIGTAKGDLILFTASGTPVRLAVGSNGQVLLVDSTEETGVKWGEVAAGAGLSEILLFA